MAHEVTAVALKLCLEVESRNLQWIPIELKHRDRRI